MNIIRKICLWILGIKEKPFLRFSIGSDEYQKPIFVYTDRRGEKKIKDAFHLWPSGGTEV